MRVRRKCPWQSLSGQNVTIISIKQRKKRHVVESKNLPSKHDHQIIKNKIESIEYHCRKLNSYTCNKNRRKQHKNISRSHSKTTSTSEINLLPAFIIKVYGSNTHANYNFINLNTILQQTIKGRTLLWSKGVLSDNYSNSFWILVTGTCVSTGEYSIFGAPQ